MPNRKLIEKTGKRRGPSILLLTAAIIACLYGGVVIWLSLGDDTNAGKPVVALTLPPEATPPPADLRADITADTTADTTTDVAPAAPSDTPGATPLSGDAADIDQLSPAEQSLLDAARNLHADSENNTGEVKIIGAETVTDGSRNPNSAPVNIGTVPPLKPVPDPALVASSSQGPLPVVAKDGRKAWQVYARPLPSGLPERQRVAIVVSGLGISESATDHAIKTLPPEVTLSFAPYGANLQSWITKARAAGHEVLLELPMEPFGYPQNDPGPYTLLTSIQPSENISRLNWLLSRFTGYVGVMNYQGARFTSDQAALSPVLSALKSRGLMFVDTGMSNRSAIPEISADIGLPVSVGTRSIDPARTSTILNQSFTALEAEAKNTSPAIGIASGFPVTVDAISDWVGTLAAKGITLVPVSATAKTE
jgi:polysaccharide deacetylase 2 family uncharacterized protein YibQ